MSKLFIQNEPFLIEEIRDYFAKRREMSKFKLLYKAGFPEIPNKNSDKFWSKINFSRAGELGNSSVYRDKMSNVLSLLEDFQGNLLDIGFGSGYLEESLKDKRINLFGIDISTRSVKSLSKKVSGHFMKAEVERIPFSSRMFNCVTLLDVLEHISPRKTLKSIREINRVMRKNSKLIVTIPLNENLEYLIKEKKINPNAHVRVYTPEILKTEMFLSGFRFISERYFYAFKDYYKLKNYFINLFPFIKKQPNLVLMVFKKK